jgi:hypothetical protein
MLCGPAIGFKHAEPDGVSKNNDRLLVSILLHVSVQVEMTQALVSCIQSLITPCTPPTHAQLRTPSPKSLFPPLSLPPPPPLAGLRGMSGATRRLRGQYRAKWWILPALGPGPDPEPGPGQQPPRAQAGPGPATGLLALGPSVPVPGAEAGPGPGVPGRSGRAGAGPGPGRGRVWACLALVGRGREPCYSCVCGKCNHLWAMLHPIQARVRWIENWKLEYIRCDESKLDQIR